MIFEIPQVFRTYAGQITKANFTPMNAILQKSLPHLAAMAAFLLLSVFFFRPQLNGKLIEQGDIMQYLGMAKEANDYRVANGKDPL